MSRLKNFNLFNESNGIENDSRLSSEIVNLLNTQIKSELESSQLYKSMACWLDDNGWAGASKYFFKSGQEELVHMDKIYMYLFERNCVAIVPPCDKVQDKFKDIRDVLELSLEHEIKVTKEWENISNVAKNNGDNTTVEFAQWFLKEQVEEEQKFRDLIFKLNLDIPKWKLDDIFNTL